MDRDFIVDHTHTLIHQTDYNILMEKRIKKILMICSSYDAYTLEEDGQIEAQISKEYTDLSISNPPSFTWTTTTKDAEKLILNDESFDLIICMFSIQDTHILNLRERLLKRNIHIPVVLLTNYSRGLDWKSKRLNFSHIQKTRMPSSA